MADLVLSSKNGEEEVQNTHLKLKELDLDSWQFRYEDTENEVCSSISFIKNLWANGFCYYDISHAHIKAKERGKVCHLLASFGQDLRHLKNQTAI